MRVIVWRPHRRHILTAAACARLAWGGRVFESRCVGWFKSPGSAPDRSASPVGAICPGVAQRKRATGREQRPAAFVRRAAVFSHPENLDLSRSPE